MRNKNQNKSTPKVKNGKVQKKNNLKLTPDYWNSKQSEVQIVEEKPGKVVRPPIIPTINYESYKNKLRVPIFALARVDRR